jgi:CspA family cold shock protein
VAKGFGFITSTEGKDIFFHVSGLIDKLLEKDDKVTFVVEEGNKGAKAVEIKKVK